MELYKLTTVLCCDNHIGKDPVSGLKPLKTHKFNNNVCYQLTPHNNIVSINN
jgi:hypothetical protein